MTAQVEPLGDQPTLNTVHVGDQMSEKRASRVSTNQSLSTISEDDLADDGIPPPIAPPDGGYGWVIVAASFLCFMVVDGTIFSMGFFLTQFEAHFNSKKAAAAWVASIMSGSYLLVGPVAAGLSNALGCRTVAILGALLSGVGLVLSQYAQSMTALYFYAGGMAGVGFGFIFLPAACTISFYFEKKRAFATGIAVCGSGIGGFFLGPMSAFLIDKYGWQTTILILSGLCFSCALIAALLKPLDVVETPDEEAAVEDSRELKNPRLSVCVAASKEQNGSTPSLNTREALATATCRSNFELNRDTADGPRKDSITASQSELKKAATSRMSASRKSVDHYRSKLSVDYGALRKRGLSVASLANSERRLTNPDLKPMLRKDIFMSASLNRVPEYRSQSNITDYRASVIHLPTLLGEDQTQVFGCIPKSFVDMLKSTLSLDLLLSPSFLLLSVAGFLTMMGFYIPFMYLSDAAQKAGIEKAQATLLLSVIGFTNTGGRVFCGWVSDMPQVSALLINNVALIAAGIATIVLPFMIGNYYCLCAYAAIFGFGVACFAALRSIIVVELFGLEKLTNGFGLLLLFQGVASLIGAPTAGNLYDSTGSYDVPFYFFGVLLTISGLMCIPVEAIRRWERRREENDNDPSTEKITVTPVE